MACLVCRRQALVSDASAPPDVRPRLRWVRPLYLVSVGGDTGGRNVRDGGRFLPDETPQGLSGLSVLCPSELWVPLPPSFSRGSGTTIRLLPQDQCYRLLPQSPFSLRSGGHTDTHLYVCIYVSVRGELFLLYKTFYSGTHCSNTLVVSHVRIEVYRIGFCMDPIHRVGYEDRIFRHVVPDMICGILDLVLPFTNIDLCSFHVISILE